MTDRERQILIARARQAQLRAQGNPPPEGMTAQQAAEQAMGGAITARRDEKARQEPTTARAASSFLGGLPFVGEWVDEGIGATLGPDAMERTRAMQRTFAEDNPNTDTALRIGGALAGAVPLAAGGAGLAGAAGLGMPASAGGRVLGGTILGALGGGTEGAVSGAGVQEDRAGNALERGLLGGAVGGGVGALAPLAGLGAGAAMNALGRRTAPAGVSAPAADIVGGVLEAEGPAALRGIRQSGPGGMVADTRGTAQLLDAVTQRPGGAARIADDAVGQRVDSAAGELRQAMDDTLGAPQGVRAIAKEARDGMRPVVSDAYDRAYTSPIDYAGPGQAIEAVLDRVPPRVLREAIAEADEIMRFEGITNRQIKANIADDGTVTFEQMPDVLQLDMLKRGLDSVAEAGKDAVTGKMTPQAARASQLARQLRSAVGDAVPAYKDALALAADKITRENAVTFGRSMLSARMTREQVAEFAADLTPAEKQYLARGIRSHVDDMTANVKRTLTDPNTDAREGAKLLSELSSRAARDKMALVLGEGPANTLQARIDRAAKAYQLRARVSENSKTAVREAYQKRIDEMMEPGAVASLLEGSPGSAAQKMFRSLSGMTDEARAAAEDKIAREIAEILTGPRGNDATRKAIELMRYMRSAPQTREIADKADRFVTSAGAVAYPAGTRALEQPRQ